MLMMSSACLGGRVSVIGMELVDNMKDTLAMALCASSNHPDLAAYAKRTGWKHSVIILSRRNLGTN